MADLRDRYADEVVALLITDPEGAEALRAATGGEDVRTPAFKSAAGPILLFRDPDEDVRQDVAGITFLQDYEPLPAVVEWLHRSQYTPLATLPDALIVGAEPLAAPDDEHDGHDDDAKALTEPEQADRAEASERPEQPGSDPVDAGDAPIDPLPIVLPNKPTDGAAVQWRVVDGQIVVTRAPIHPSAVPSDRQRDAVAALLSIAVDGTADLADWRKACRDRWMDLKSGSSIVIFKRAIMALQERGAIRIEGEQVTVIPTTDGCSVLNSQVFGSEQSDVRERTAWRSTVNRWLFNWAARRT